MKLKSLLAALFVGGLFASMAVAKPPPGHANPGKDKGGATVAATTGTSTSTTSTTASGPGKSGGKVTLCHKTGSATNPWVKIRVSAKTAAQHRKHGDVDPVGGRCPAPKTKPGSTTASSTTTTATTVTTTTTSGVAAAQ
jgi:hypothetical protein